MLDLTLGELAKSGTPVIFVQLDGNPFHWRTSDELRGTPKPQHSSDQHQELTPIEQQQLTPDQPQLTPIAQQQVTTIAPQSDTPNKLVAPDLIVATTSIDVARYAVIQDVTVKWLVFRFVVDNVMIK